MAWKPWRSRSCHSCESACPVEGTVAARIDHHRHIGMVVVDGRAVRRALKEMDVEILPGRRLDFLDPRGNRWQVVEYSEIRFTKAPHILRGMGLGHLKKTENALEELRKEGPRAGVGKTVRRGRSRKRCWVS